MKKMVSTLTALALALGLASAGFAQITTGKEAQKPAVKTEAPASQPQVAPVEKEKTGVEKATKLETKKSKQAKAKAKKEAKATKGKKAADKPEHPAAPAKESKPETK